MQNITNQAIAEGYMFLCSPDERNAIIHDTHKEINHIDELLRMEDEGGHTPTAPRPHAKASLYEKVCTRIKSLL